MWDVYLYTGAGTWVSQTAFPNPGRVTLLQNLVSTARKESLLDGSVSYNQPERTWAWSPIRLAWYKQITLTLQTRLENYIKSGSGLKIVAHTGKEFIGKIADMDSDWAFSGKYKEKKAPKQKYWLEIDFEIYDQEALRDQQW